VAHPRELAQAVTPKPSPACLLFMCTERMCAQKPPGSVVAFAACTLCSCAHRVIWAEAGCMTEACNNTHLLPLLATCMQLASVIQYPKHWLPPPLLYQPITSSVHHPHL
jgi:hypothetical protein